MNHSVTCCILSLENQYAHWLKSGEKTRDLTCQIKEISLKIIFQKGSWFYPFPNCPTPVVTENTINISSSSNDKIKKIFKKKLIKVHKGYYFSNDRQNKFQIRFFQNENAMKNFLSDEEKSEVAYQDPKWGLRYECTLI